ncbi:MAG: flavodoxin domain-containing protein [Pseudomonadota bacterium]
MQIHFLHGTETGTAEFLCEDLQAAFGDAHDTQISSLEDVDVSALENGPLYVVVSATFGSGDVPGTGVDFYEALQKNKPDLSHIRFAVFGLGDTSFGDTYNQGSEKLMTEMLACKAEMVGERGLFDSSSPEMPEDIAIPWLTDLLTKIDG